jgi:prepilin-type N-terminal cleavage/methylation domain-containing protein
MGKRFGSMLGFTLIEMAIVLAIMGIIMSGGLLAVSPVIENAKISETNQRLDRIEQALIVHVIRNGCLPCPATGNVASTTADVGEAVDTGGAYASGCADTNCTSRQGVVPWINLGLSEADITDGWGTRISYVVTFTTPTANLTQTSDMVRSPPAGYPAGDLIVQNNSNVEVTGGVDGDRAAYVLISHGSNRHGGFIASTGAAINNATASAFETDNTDGNPAYRQDSYNGTAANYFDDLVRWRSAPMIIQLCGNNACGNPA